MTSRTAGSQRTADREGAEAAIAVGSCAFVCVQVALIPFGMVPPAWFTACSAVLGAGVVLGARLACPAAWSRVVLWPVLVVLGVYGAAAALGSNPALSAQRFSSLPLQALIFPCVQLCALRRRTLAALLVAAAVAVVAMAFDGAWARFAGGSPFHDLGIEKGRRAGSQGNANDMAAATALLPIAFAAVPPAASRAWLVVIACAGAVPGLAVASRQAIGGWAIACASWALATGTRRRAVAVTLGIVGALASAVALHPGLRKRVGLLLEDGLGMRQQLILHGWDRFLERPLLGWGPGLYRELHAAGIESGWQSGGTPLPNVVIPWVHCLPLELLMDVGLLGFAAVSATVWVGLRRAWSARRCDDIEAKAAIGGGCALLVLSAIALVDLSLLKDWVRCATWLALGLTFLQRRVPGKLTGDPAR
jgi:hypothetical protein